MPGSRRASPTRRHGCLPSLPVSDRWRTEAVSSLDDARRLAEDNRLPLDVDDWTYAVMVRDGIAPPTRPESVLQPEGEYPGTGARHDLRQKSWDVLQRAREYIGLTI